MVHRSAATEKVSPSNSPGNPPAATSGSKSRAGANAEPEAVSTLRWLLPHPARQRAQDPRLRYRVAGGHTPRLLVKPAESEKPRNETHSQALKRKFGELEARAAVYVELYELLRDRSDIESAEIFKRIRMGGPRKVFYAASKKGIYFYSCH
ncbi:hypothetical protein QC761_0087490 [Podospora bellae-mahoneyi]|uniref:Uncharacterized protein n=1 Tax=Podospora bellae-mahoneyi TaxID=2093777 RepID=A0ABR0F7L5_9PEZI|nr:hypothetical protein QC761_0087490 [Podospora bellae-mahoneyi]